MSAADYPTLGFDPAPGDRGAVTAAAHGLASARDCLGDAALLLHRLNSSTDGSWSGDAADAFREHLSEDVPRAFAQAHDSFDAASRALSMWDYDLSVYQAQARELEREAREAKAALEAARAHLADVHAHPYYVEGEQTPAAVADARSRQTAAVSEATRGVDRADGDLADVIARARTLESAHHDAAGRTADDLRSAPDHLAPEKPGVLSSVGHWLGDHSAEIGDLLADVSAVSGFLALVTPPPIDVVCAGVAAVAGVGALAAHVAGGKHDFWTVTGDVVGMVPGIGAVGEAAKGARLLEGGVDGLRYAREAGNAGERLFGMRYAASGLEDTARAVPGALRSGLEETRVLGSNLSRGLVGGLERVPGVTIEDGITLAANIDRGLTGVGAGLGGLDVTDKMTGSQIVDHLPAASESSTVLAGRGAGLDSLVEHHVLPIVQVR